MREALKSRDYRAARAAHCTPSGDGRASGHGRIESPRGALVSAQSTAPALSEVENPAADEPLAATPAAESVNPAEVREQERQKAKALALVTQLSEVKAYCKEQEGCTMVESGPGKGCKPSADDKRACAWGIAVGHVEPSGPHLSHFARFYVRENGQLFVEPIQTGGLVSVSQWRCLQKRGYDVDACGIKP